ncbi:MAG TPA: DMT family transporter [Solirubrobacteraceae bacterium]|nr:DMT family transporter [Solirubrobacteraceae bacterium]
MRDSDNVIAAAAATPRSGLGRESSRVRLTIAAPGTCLGALGVLAFSFTFPATKLAVDGLNPWLVAFARAAVAAVLAAAVLLATRAPTPDRAQRRRLLVVAGGVVVGFPLFSSLALTTTGSAHGAVVIAVLPAATALVAVIRGGERPPLRFWIAASAGLAVVVAFTIVTAHGALGAGDALLLLGTALCAVGYAEGASVSRTLGGSRTICWALVLAAPLTIPVTVILGIVAAPSHAGPSAWLGFAYVAVVSMLLGFFAWYAGLARGGTARVSQIQLLQPLLTVVWSAAVLGERIGAGTLIAGAAVLACVAATQRTRNADDRRSGAGPTRATRSGPAGMR